MFAPASTVLGLMRQGTVKALATTGRQRASIAPDLPTISEAAIPDFDTGLWFGILAPAGTPAPIIDKLYGTIEEVLRSEDTKRNLDQQGATPLYKSTAEFGAYIKDEMTKWGPVVQKAGMKPE
jgi:tripartite-type tricarboxylate transporter receptor subunit TctC